MSKAGAGVVLKCLLGRENEIDIDALPWGEDPYYDISEQGTGEKEIVGGYETVVLAREVRVKDGVKIYP